MPLERLAFQVNKRGRLMVKRVAWKCVFLGLDRSQDQCARQDQRKVFHDKLLAHRNPRLPKVECESSADNNTNRLTTA